jgi:hypothetical protein
MATPKRSPRLTFTPDRPIARSRRGKIGSAKSMTGFYGCYDHLIVLSTTPMPAVLLEAGSIVNPNEERELATPEGRKPHEEPPGAAQAGTNRHARNLALRSTGAQCSGGGDVDIEVDLGVGGDDGDDDERRGRHPSAVRNQPPAEGPHASERAATRQRFPTTGHYPPVLAYQTKAWNSCLLDTAAGGAHRFPLRAFSFGDCAPCGSLFSFSRAKIVGRRKLLGADNG